MAMRDLQCPHCGHYFNSDHPYFSEDFARTFLPGRNIGLSWCLHCGHIAEYRQVKLLFIKLPAMKVARIYPVAELTGQDYFNAPFGNMGGLFGFQLLRLIWFAVEARTKLDHGPEHTLAQTLRALLQRLPPLAAAGAIIAFTNTQQSLQLEEILTLGIYVAEVGIFIKQDIERILREDASLPNREAVLTILTELEARQHG